MVDVKLSWKIPLVHYQIEYPWEWGACFTEIYLHTPHANTEWTQLIQSPNPKWCIKADNGL